MSLKSIRISPKTIRIVKNVTKVGAWYVGDIFFLALKAIATVVLIAITTVALFMCVFLLYLQTNLTTGLEVNPQDFSMSKSSVIVTLDRETGEDIELVTIQSVEFRRWVDFHELPQHLIDALIAIEDHRFMDHHGVDWYRTAGAFMNMFLGMRDTFGGSTITQQLIKNLTHEDDVTVQRKLQEIFRALEYERFYTKEEILELYLNLVYFGHGCYGIGAAAHHYFGKEVSELTLAESASIVGITNNPSRFSPYSSRDRNKTRQEIILNRMYVLGYIDSDQDLKRYITTPLNFQRGRDEEFEQVIYTWFEEAIIRDVIDDLVASGHSDQIARRLVYTGGLRIVSTINLDMQSIVDEIYENRELLPEVTGSSLPLQSSIIIADPYNGDILAMSGGTGTKTRNLLLNRATQTRRPPGSAIKPISAYAPAMDLGLLRDDTVFIDDPDIELMGTTWLPRNANRSHAGEVTARQALAASINTTAAVIVDELSPARSFRFMRDVLGFDLDAADNDYAPMAAGQLTYGATTREMADAFTMFPNSGHRSVLRTYSRVYDADGKILINNSPQYIEAISRGTADLMTDMLVDAVVAGTGRDAQIGEDMPTAGKTGTSTDNRDRWFVGFSPYFLAAVWTGYDTPAHMRATGNPAAQIFSMIMTPIHEDLPIINFRVPNPFDLPPLLSLLMPEEIEEEEEEEEEEHHTPGGGGGSSGGRPSRPAPTDPTDPGGGGDDPGAQGLGEHERVAVAQAGVAQHPVRVDLAGHGQAELRLRVIDRVPAGGHVAALRRDLGRSGEHVLQHAGGQFTGVPADEVEGEQRAAAHRVHIRDGIDRGHPPPGARVIDDGRDEIGRRHQGAVVAQPPDRRVIAGLHADQQIRVTRVDMAQYLRQLARGELAGSTGAVAELGEPPQPLVHPCSHRSGGRGIAHPSLFGVRQEGTGPRPSAPVS